LVSHVTWGTWENRVLWRIKREEVKGGFRKVHNKELHKFYPSPNIITVVKRERMR
jgi:hypothetical protein